MRIAFLGIRGVPANYGGFETFVEELGARLVDRGHQVTVYGRTGWVPSGLSSFRGMRLIRLPAPRSKYLETVVHGVFSAVHAMFKRYDVIYVCNSANVPAVIILRGIGKRVVLNVDGLEWQRTKWSRFGRTYYRACAAIAARLPVYVVTDARVIQAYYQRAYRRATDYFPYGTDLSHSSDDGLLGELGLTSRGYILYVSRLEPENNAHVVIEAYRSVRTELPLAVVGDAPYASDYIASLRRTTDSRIRFLGGIYGHGYRVLQSNAFVYVQATEVGGTHPALVEAMGAGSAIVANDVPEHREVLGELGRYYSGAAALAAELRRLLDHPEEAESLRIASLDRARSLYSWDAITSSYEQWFLRLVQRTGRHASDA